MTHRRVSLHDPSGYQNGLESSKSTEIEVAVLGAANVGKTAIVSQFLHSQFPEKYIPTIDDMSWVEYETGTGRDLLLKIIDSSGSHEFAAMRSLYIRTADAFILVCSVANQQSIEEIVRILDEIKRRNEKDPQIVVVANKIDLSENLEDSLEILDAVANFASSNVIKHHAITAKDHNMVLNVFRTLFGNFKKESSSDFQHLRVRRQSLPPTGDVKSKMGPQEDRSHSCILS